MTIVQELLGGPFVDLVCDTVRVNDSAPKLVNTGRPASAMTGAVVTAVDHFVASLDLLPIPGLHRVKEPIHIVGHLNSRASRQDLTQLAP